MKIYKISVGRKKSTSYVVCCLPRMNAAADVGAIFGDNLNTGPSKYTEQHACWPLRQWSSNEDISFHQTCIAHPSRETWVIQLSCLEYRIVNLPNKRMFVRRGSCVWENRWGRMADYADVWNASSGWCFPGNIFLSAFMLYASLDSPRTNASKIEVSIFYIVRFLKGFTISGSPSAYEV